MTWEIFFIILMLISFGLLINFLNKLMRPTRRFSRNSFKEPTDLPSLLIAIGAKLISKKFLQPGSGQSSEAEKYHYKVKEYFMSRPEHELYDLLVQLFGFKYHIFAQVHLSTILDQKVVGQNWQAAFRHVNGKSVDYVVCDKAYIKPLLAIELDDGSHDDEDRIARDEEVERILEEAQLPLLRLDNHGQFDRLGIYQKVSAALE
jgi:hypothetical protein